MTNILYINIVKKQIEDKYQQAKNKINLQIENNQKQLLNLEEQAKNKINLQIENNQKQLLNLEDEYQQAKNKIKLQIENNQKQLLNLEDEFKKKIEWSKSLENNNNNNNNNDKYSQQIINLQNEIDRLNQEKKETKTYLEEAERNYSEPPKINPKWREIVLKIKKLEKIKEKLEIKQLISKNSQEK